MTVGRCAIGRASAICAGAQLYVLYYMVRLCVWPGCMAMGPHGICNALQPHEAIHHATSHSYDSPPAQIDTIAADSGQTCCYYGQAASSSELQASFRPGGYSNSYMQTSQASSAEVLWCRIS